MKKMLRNNIKIAFLLSLAANTAITSSTIFNNWTVSETTLTNTNEFIYTVYNPDSQDFSDAIWLVGGNHIRNTVYYYNITSNSITNYDTLSTTNTNTYAISSQAAVIYTNNTNDYIYFATSNGVIYKYDIRNKQQTSFYYDAMSPFSNPCLVKSSTNGDYTDLLYVVESSSNFWIYNFTNGNWTQGASLNKAHFYRYCSVNSVNNNEFLYVLGGSTVFIEKLDLADPFANDWMLLSSTLNTSDGVSIDYENAAFLTAISYKHYIFLLGGNDGNYHDDIVYLNCKTDTVEFDSDFIYNARGISGVYVLFIYVWNSVFCFLCSTIYRARISFLANTPKLDKTRQKTIKETLDINFCYVILQYNYPDLLKIDCSHLVDSTERIILTQ